MPAGNADKKAKMKWLLDLCRKHVENYVVQSEVSTLVQQTENFEKASADKFHCRVHDCDKSFKLHSRRVM